MDGNAISARVRSDRIASASAVALFHALLGYAFLTGLGVDVASRPIERLKMFEVVEPPPPPPEPERPPPPPDERKEGAAAPPNLEARASPVVAPEPVVALPLPPPVVAAPTPGSGAERSAGAAEVAGPGSGGGGIGTGTGAGRGGDGTGSGFTPVRARLVKGRLRNSDYQGGRGIVTVKLAVGANGRVQDCTVSGSSGNAELDATTCRLIVRRFRFEPARDRAGEPVADVVGWQQRWWLKGEDAPLPRP